MNNILIIYKGYNPHELNKIETNLKKHNIPFYNSYGDKIKTYDEPLELADECLVIISWILFSRFFQPNRGLWRTEKLEAQCLKKKGYLPHPFGIQVLQKDAEIAKKILLELNLDEETISIPLNRQNLYLNATSDFFKKFAADQTINKLAIISLWCVSALILLFILAKARSLLIF